LIVKLSPNVEDITQTAKATIDGGADALSMVNTFTAMAIDIQKRRPRLANVTGGLSGPAIKPIALHLVSRVYRNVAKHAGVPIIGMGGVQYWQDAAEFILAGASAVAIGTALTNATVAPELTQCSATATPPLPTTNKRNPTLAALTHCRRVGKRCRRSACQPSSSAPATAKRVPTKKNAPVASIPTLIAK